VGRLALGQAAPQLNPENHLDTHTPPADRSTLHTCGLLINTRWWEPELAPSSSREEGRVVPVPVTVEQLVRIVATLERQKLGELR